MPVSPLLWIERVAQAVAEQVDRKDELKIARPGQTAIHGACEGSAARR